MSRPRRIPCRGNVASALVAELLGLSLIYPNLPDELSREANVQ